MTENIRLQKILTQAFTEYAEEKSASGVFNEEEFPTSAKFEKKMAKMIKSEHNLYHKATLTRARRVLLIAAIILALLLSSLSVGAVRDLIANFFVQHFSTHDTIKANLEDDYYPTELEEVYELGYIPDGYELMDKVITDNEATYAYIVLEDAMLFKQSTKDSFIINQDNEHSKVTTEVYNGQEYYISEMTNDEHEITFIWDNGKYMFLLSADLPKDTMLKMCESIKVKKVIKEKYPTTLEEVYELGEIPDGYEFEDKSITSNDATYMYSSDKDTLVFIQSTKDAFSLNQDNEYSSKSTEIYNGQEYYISEELDEDTTIIWDNGKYVFFLSANLPKETMFDLANSLKVKEQ